MYGVRRQHAALMFRTIYKPFVPHAHSCFDHLRKMTVYFLHAILRRYIQSSCAQQYIKFISAVKNYKGIVSRKFDINKDTIKIFRNTTCAHRQVFCDMRVEQLINLIGHIWHPYFSEHTGIAECVLVSKNLQSNSQQQNNLPPESF